MSRAYSRIGQSVFLAAAAWAVASNTHADPPRLTHLSTVTIYDKSNGLTEPSGLSLAPDGGFLVVSDDTRRILKLSEDGRASPVTAKHPALKDLEGITADEHRVLAVTESSGAIIELQPDNPKSLRIVQLADLAGKQTSDIEWGGDNGLEGIAISPATGRTYLVKERAPRLLIELSPDLSRIETATSLAKGAGFDVPGVKDDTLDVSGIAADPGQDALWILSDTGSSVFFYDLNTHVAERLALTVPRDGKAKPLRNPEGVAVSNDRTRLHVVTDDHKSSKLVTYRIE